MKNSYATALFLLFSVPAIAQQESPGKEKVTKSYGNATLEFINNSVFLGRGDSLKTPYLSPGLGYFDKSGFFIEGSFSYLMRSGASRIDASLIDAGYSFSAGNFSGEITAEKNFYNGNSTNVKSEVKGSLYFSAGYDFGFAETTLATAIDFLSKNDYKLAWGIDHRFVTAGEKLEIFEGV